MRKTGIFASLVMTVVAAGCRAPAEPYTDLVDVTSSVIAIQSTAGGTRLDPAAGIIITFDRSMLHPDSMQVVLHEGDAAGPVITAAATWSADWTTLTLRPAGPLAAATRYTVELRCACMDGATHDAHHAGTAGSGMGSLHGGSGSAMGSGMMGAGAQEMTHRMTFTFTTA